MKIIAITFIMLATQYTHAAVYNCNGTFTDTPCGNTPAMRITPNSGFSPTPTTLPHEKPEATKKDEEPGARSISTSEPKFCKQLRVDLEDARWRKANMRHPENIKRAVEDEKRLVDEIWFKCSKKFE